MVQYLIIIANYNVTCTVHLNLPFSKISTKQKPVDTNQNTINRVEAKPLL